MSPISRRSVLGSLAATGLSAAVLASDQKFGKSSPHRIAQKVKPPIWHIDDAQEKLDADSIPKPRRSTDTAVRAENAKPGSATWRLGADGTRVATDAGNQIKGYASATSVNLGGKIAFHISAGEPFEIAIFRLGWYGGSGARKILTTRMLAAASQPPLSIDVLTGMISCDWAPTWTLNVGKKWVPGTYIAVLTTKAGWRNYVPFVVRDPAKKNGFCIVLPFATYQAYNMWPHDGLRGRSLYLGYAGTGIFGDVRPDGKPLNKGDSTRRARKVSFDRPFHDHGLPFRFDEDHYMIQWVECMGYDLNYATSIDLETGAVDPRNYQGLVFSGHDEYWSRAMRETIEHGIRQGISMAYMAANNVYWHIRFETSAKHRPNRVMACYKTGEDAPDYPTSATMLWRDPHPGPANPEQAMLGVQFNGIVNESVPLVVRSSNHWFWEGCGVADGEAIPHVVDGEADAYNPSYPAPVDVDHTLLSASPYQLKNGSPMMQNSSLYETRNGAIVFVAGTFNWTKSLGYPALANTKIQQATLNLLDRITV